MFPNLFSIGPLTFHTYGLFVALGFFVGLMVTIRLGKSEGIAPQIIMDMGFIIILCAIIGSRLMYILMNASGFSQRPLDIFKIWQGGLVFSGGVIVVVPAVLWYVKRHNLSWWKVADLWAPAAALGQAFGRIGCFMAGCCYGNPTDQKWGVVFTNPESLGPLNVFLHPTQLYSAISGFIIFIVLMLLRQKKKFDGRIFLWFLILHSTARLAIERFRGDDRGMFVSSNMTTTQLVTILILIASVVTLLAFIKSKVKEKPYLP
ncbi:MAG: prolipoprotein diacylglyceryl transferase [Desulfobacterales bacterium]|nr:prolipoprotein diacylglyceryl transferase [Desulfobacterales bacterium]